MNRLECHAESQKYLSSKIIGHRAVRRTDGLKVESQHIQPRKDSTVLGTQMAKELGELEVVSTDGILPKETNEGTSRSAYSRNQSKSAGGSAAMSSALKSCPRRTREYAGSAISNYKAIMTDIEGKQSPGSTGKQACAQEQADSVQSPGYLCITSQDESKLVEEGAINDDEERRAPIELFAEFLKSVMDKDYILANKLCQMILIYEPDNPEARQFIPLIEEKLLLAAQEEGEDDESSDETEDSSDSSDSGGESSERSDSSPSEQE